MQIFNAIKEFIKEGFNPKSFYSKSVVKILLFKFVFIMGFLLLAYGPHLRQDINEKVISDIIIKNSNYKQESR